MHIIQAIVLGVVQGLTEFVPVSSSAHLVLVPWAFGWPTPSLLFDTMLHWGTLLAVLIYFWRDWLVVVRGFVRSLTKRGPWNASAEGRLSTPESRLAWCLIIGSVPAAAVGYFLDDYFEGLFANPNVRLVAIFLLVTAALLVLSEWLGRRSRALNGLTWWEALIIGAAQAVAIFPGISRSGATIAAGLGLGLRRESAARFSFMLATPVILGAGLLQLVRLVESPSSTEPGAVSVSAVIAGFLASVVAGYLSIELLLTFLQRRKLFVFAGYCTLVAVVVLVFGA